eukprot:849699-Alexandrium_andersonii.AAC.1
MAAGGTGSTLGAARGPQAPHQSGLVGRVHGGSNLGPRNSRGQAGAVRKAEALTAAAVSYTHLTLPTICSV